MYEAVATVLTVYGIETSVKFLRFFELNDVATVLTVYGIETFHTPPLRLPNHGDGCNSTYRLRY